ncbi:bifunctional phosphoglucose/phosphomannose isomerase [Cesiribacter andamanensis]|uniref:Bifunctional phosphoglucose/phosphomannose isomerase n=1 Tax=Cesiribacter andamanensis AMV16 TaxID=1279009 RepID=M7NAE6_9BACT|nr:bifunctional phosphoglucose/phosphomannose isomerase [Cesiribacter andamanensis]EMR04171.1 bifunctional phosphoglucose/phosphomannose isomerase [Cesiribacter andamanensis AMV16]
MDKMKKLIEDFSNQLRDALRIGKEASIQPPAREIRNVVVAGMGGSGIGGSLLASLVQDQLRVPLLVCKTYDIPAFVNEHTLFIASSFSGDTEETLSALEQALQAGAQCVAITSGGAIGSLARRRELEVISIPGESKSPRANIGYSLVQLLFMLQYKGLIGGGFAEEVERLAHGLDQEEESLRLRAEKLANSMKGYLPVIYADSRLYPLAVRIQQQLNENGKHLCHVHELPEMNHNELVGWEHPEQVLTDCKVYFLLSSYDHPRVRERFRISREILAKKAANVSTIEASGQSLLEQCLYLIHFTDWISYFLAKANDKDPFPVQAIDYLKSELEKVK